MATEGADFKFCLVYMSPASGVCCVGLTGVHLVGELL